ncbi:hypothetical protein Pcinc_039939, partial [Petrolisthes cinctipes]
PPPGLVWGGSGANAGRVTETVVEGQRATTTLTVQAIRATAHSTLSCSTTNASVSSGIMHTVSTTLRVNHSSLSQGKISSQIN